ncbi:hypothetical protein G3576_00810 [Roseomonas stagni]|uniref:Uncharacterized protein n=1 Tax=Falsiroseomonas algicola TaxID=2716930 RepID=A0A6M1LE23_9PROT|nr:hypothetical protein [Falsiroseomonas algicola]NGM18533.1 hypothetical protein [Falsiroseomonas algicola]
MPLTLRIASYWLGVTLAALAWWLAIDALEMWPLPVQMALASMVPMAGFWWHLVLFQDILKARKAARRAAMQPRKEAAAAAPAPDALPDTALRAALWQVRAEAASMAWDAALQRELQLRTECDADFARIIAPLTETERAVLLLAARGPVVRKRLALAAQLLMRDRGRVPGEDPLRERLRQGLAAISPSLGEDFAMVMQTAGDLDPVSVARHLIAHPATVMERAPRAALLRDATALLNRDQRPATRAAMAALLASQVERPLEALLEAYIATARAPEAVALAALGAATPRTAQGIA